MGEISTTQTSSMSVSGKTFTLKTTLSTSDGGSVTPTPQPTVTPTPTPNPGLPNDGIPSKPGANQDAKTWTSKQMSKDPSLWKVVDDKNINVFEEFHSKANADQYIAYYVNLQTKPQTKAVIAPTSLVLKPNTQVVLDGSKSTTETQGNITFVWSPLPGSPAILFNSISNPTFEFATTTEEGDLNIQLQVVDGNGKTDQTQISLKVSSAIVTPTPTPQPAGGRDVEGIQMLYPDDTDPVKAAQAWYLSKFGPNDARVSGKGARKIIPGTNIVEVTPDPGTHPASARIYVRTTNPKANDANTQLILGSNWIEMEKKKYMVGPEDFRNCEVTHYYKIVKSSASDEMTTYWMGGAHPSDDTWPLQCIACCNKAQIKMDMTPRAAKEYHHFASPDGYAWNPKPPLFNLSNALGGTMVGKMIGQKLVMYVIENADGMPKEVHMELYVDVQSKDLPAPNYDIQKWQLFCEWIDNGSNWPDPKNAGYITNCKAKKGQMISWGGPYIALRLDDNIWQLHALSIRPIQAPVSK